MSFISPVYVVITALDKNSVNKKGQLLPVQMPKARSGKCGLFYTIIGYFLKGVGTKNNVILDKILNCFSLCYCIRCHTLLTEVRCL